MSRTAATALAVLLVTACTGGDETADPRIDTVLDTLDVDDAAGTDVVFYDLATGPDGPPVALVGAAGAAQSWLVRLPSGAATAIPAVEPDSELVIADDGTPLVVGTALTSRGGAVLPLPRRTPGRRPPRRRHPLPRP